ncbi:MAG: amidohydrolase [Planctomycetes bacterium]|nr:amidohydrolase [Planctomycetota bacterium]
MQTFLFVLLMAVPAADAIAQKEALYDSINRRDEASWQAAMKIWEWAEPGYQETKSSALLAEMLEEAGFETTWGAADIPTAFTAEFGEGKPVIGILGEYDALPGLSQEAVPQRDPREETEWGHACGHHLFGVASASAAIAIAEQIREGNLQGTVRFYGCPAEEGGGAKVFMVREGLFADCDAALHWHPSSRNSAGDKSSLARIAAKFRFFGNPAHAAGAPDQGRSALDAVELTNHATQLLREHTPDFTRIHHVITDGGSAPNIVPEFAEVYYYIRHPQSKVLRPLYRRLQLCAEAGALATETTLEIDYQGGIREILPNNALAQVALKNLQELNDLEIPAGEQPFAARLQQTLSQPQPLEDVGQVYDQSGTFGTGSTDVGDVSWVTPTSGFTTACWVPGTPGHSWQATACGATPQARRGMNLAARVLAATAWDIYTNPQLLEAAKAEHRKRVGEVEYESLLLPGQPPPLDYRKPPKRQQLATKEKPSEAN